MDKTKDIPYVQDNHTGVLERYEGCIKKNQLKR
jgi:hypothetical protein